MWEMAWESESMAIDEMIAESERKEDLKNWTHTMQNWNKIKIKDMKTEHIKNVIKYFLIYDQSNRFYNELRSRGVNWRIIQ